MYRTDRFIACHGTAAGISLESCNAEIHHLDGTGRGKHDVLRLDVAVDDAVIMRML